MPVPSSPPERGYLSVAAFGTDKHDVSLQAYLKADWSSGCRNSSQTVFEKFQRDAH